MVASFSIPKRWNRARGRKDGVVSAAEKSFGELTGADAAIIRPLLRRRAIAAGTTVFQRGDKVDTVYLVVSGLLRISVTSVDGRELAFRVVGPGEMVATGDAGAGVDCPALR